MKCENWEFYDKTISCTLAMKYIYRDIIDHEIQNIWIGLIKRLYKVNFNIYDYK